MTARSATARLATMDKFAANAEKVRMHDDLVEACNWLSEVRGRIAEIAYADGDPVQLLAEIRAVLEGKQVDGVAT